MNSALFSDYLSGINDAISYLDSVKNQKKSNLDRWIAKFWGIEKPQGYDRDIEILNEAIKVLDYEITMLGYISSLLTLKSSIEDLEIMIAKRFENKRQALIDFQERLDRVIPIKTYRDRLNEYKSTLKTETLADLDALNDIDELIEVADRRCDDCYPIQSSFVPWVQLFHYTKGYNLGDPSFWLNGRFIEYRNDRGQWKILGSQKMKHSDFLKSDLVSKVFANA